MSEVGTVGWESNRANRAERECDRLKERIAELEAELLSAAASLETVYGELPSHTFPGPPTTIVEHMRAVANRNKT
jgi:hypothetical protein